MTTITMQTARDLAARAADGHSASLRQFTRLAREAGFTGRAGGWIHDTHKPHNKALAQGWQSFAFEVSHPHRIGSRRPAYADAARRIMQLLEGRVLVSTWRLARYGSADAECGQYGDAIDAGAVIRESVTAGDDPDWVRLVRYVDPVDGSTRFVVDTQQPDGGEWVDFQDEGTAGSRYEDAVRSQARVGYLYAVTDVATERESDE